MTISAVADTHAVIWYLYNDRRLSQVARTFFETTSKSGEQIGVSSITLAEIVYLVEKSRIPVDAFRRLLAVFDMQDSVLTEIAFDRHIAEVLPQISRASVPDLPDRLIVATALHKGVPLISRDAMIQTSGVATIW